MYVVNSLLYLLCLCVTSCLTGRYVIMSACKSGPDEQCVEIRRCPYFADLLDRSAIPRPRHVIKIIREHHCGFSGHSPKVCCAVPTTTTSTTTAATTTTRRTTTSTTTSPAPIFETFSLEAQLQNHKNYKLLPNNLCGPIPTDSRITAGTKTAVGEFPWMALIAYYTNEGLDFRCGGTVINNRYVLTAAHCILNSTIVGVRLGEHNLDTTSDCEPGTDYCASKVQDFYIESVTVHPEYDSKTFLNDVALLRLATTADFTADNVKPICLPIEDTAKNDLNGKYAIVSGWGVTEDGFKSPDLLKVSLPVVSIKDCQKIYKRFAPISETQICAGGQMGRDSCGGDSGGPLKYVGIIDGSPRYVQYGIVSYGPRHCGTDGQPGIYTRVSSYLQWILDNLKPAKD